MRNPWPLFFVAVITAALCIVLPIRILWLTLVAIAVLLGAWLVLPEKYNECFFTKINPYLVEYQKSHDFDALNAGLNRCRMWAITKECRNAISVNRFSALLEQERWEESQNELEQIRQRAKTTIDWINYHLFVAEYARKRSDENLAKREQQLSDRLKTKLKDQKSNPTEPATAKQSKHAFIYWLTFSMCLMIGGGACVYLGGESVLSNFGVAAFFVSLPSLAVTLAWLVTWIVRSREEHAVRYLNHF